METFKNYRWTIICTILGACISIGSRIMTPSEKSPAKASVGYYGYTRETLGSPTEMTDADNETLFIAPKHAKGYGFGTVKITLMRDKVPIVCIYRDGYDGKGDDAFEAVDLQGNLKEDDRCRFFWFDGHRQGIGGVRFAIKAD